MSNRRRETRAYGGLNVQIIYTQDHGYSPCKDILRVIIPEIDFRRSADRNALCLSVICRKQVRL